MHALGLWRSTFGEVKVEADDSKGGLQAGAIHGVWVYQRNGVEVRGYFAGRLRGNVLDMRWNENPTLAGAGYLVFDPSGRQYTGRWWTDRRDRNGEWNGWRDAVAAPSPVAAAPPPPPAPSAPAMEPSPAPPAPAPPADSGLTCDQKREKLVAWLTERTRRAIGPTPDPDLQWAADNEIAKWKRGFLKACEVMGPRLDDGCFVEGRGFDPHCRPIMGELMRRVGFPDGPGGPPRVQQRPRD
jgi:hypothetical protein